ncbi:DUF222 domain-containing protein [Tersicoccus sp. MR15.9]|uniref:HNH endonuclease signature motif containing protein n=1 Tax=Tersicoccus mangrovi TaxID=3121635 RepID=UPI002FE5EEC2
MSTAPAERPTLGELPAGEVAARLTRAVQGGLSLESGVAALEDLRRLEAWLVWTKHRLVADTAEAAAREQARWVRDHPLGLGDGDEESDGLPGGRGLSRAERLGVGERAGVAEVACALHSGEGEVHGLLRRADRLTGQLPATASALAAGIITSGAGSVILDAITEYADALTATGIKQVSGAAWSEAIAATEACLLEAAVRGRTPAQLRSRARRVRDRLHPRSFRERERCARADRFVRISSDRDGMARLSALLPAAVVYRIDGRLSSLARGLQEALMRESAAMVGDTATRNVAPGTGAPAAAPPSTASGPDADRPTIGQLRADVLADLLVGLGIPRSAEVFDGTVSGASGRLAAGSRGDPHLEPDGGPVPRVLLTVPASTMLGGDVPGELGEFGQIPAADARDLGARAGSFLLGVTGGLPSSSAGVPTGGSGSSECDFDGRVVPVLVTTGQLYRIRAAVRRALQVRDGTCRFPGCRRNATACDLDHVTAWTDGGTSEGGNLAHLCRKHHVLKHHSGWTVTAASPSDGRDAAESHGGGGRADHHPPPGPDALIWTSPAGRRYLAEPDDPPPF